MIIQKPGVIVDCTLPFQNKLPAEDRLHFKARVLMWDQAVEYGQELEKTYALPLAEQFVPYMALIRRVATDWTNAVDSDGKVLPFADESFKMMPPELVRVIAAQLVDAAAWGDIKKNT